MTNCFDGSKSSAPHIAINTKAIGAAATDNCGVHRIKDDVERGLEIKVAFGDLSPLYIDCQRVRAEAGDKVLCHRYDARSYHFVMFRLGQPVGTLTATRCSDGPVDQEPFYPLCFLNTYRANAFSLCKLRINPFDLRSLGAFRCFMEAAWSYLIGQGLRFDIMNCEVSKRKAYESMGYRCVNGFDFIHSDLGTVSRVMIMGADPNHPSLFRTLFQSLSNTVSINDTFRLLSLTLRAPESPTKTSSH